MTETSSQFTGSIPEFYHQNLGPVFMEPYATDLVGRLSIADDARLLELAAGTGIVTRRIIEKLPRNASLIASDLNEAMMDVARKHVPADDRLSWKVIDALEISYPDHSFDHVVSQFGFMFFPDKVAAAREARRVLKPGGQLLFSVWDSLEHNDMVRTGQEIILKTFPDNPPTFYIVPFHYHNTREIEAHLKEAGFREIEITRVPMVSRSRSARDAARGLILGNPISIEIAQRGADADRLMDDITDLLASRYGAEPMECRMAAFVVEAR